ncbi:hypothetical protein DVR14_21100 (plasmid) [Natrinema thermotolerans]|nr:hypothetical protein DVR14_16975 [Natrinema thermotolerans]QCC61142.1 hypothetical protein DVR14_21100 [Natrinema thermotolerans]
MNRSLDNALQIGDDEDDEPDFIYGDIAHDDEVDEPEDLVVVNLPPVTADEWELEDETLADQNPKYPADDDVVITVEFETLDKVMPDWDLRETPIPLDELEEAEIAYEPFPEHRLIREEDSHLR